MANRIPNLIDDFKMRIFRQDEKEIQRYSNVLTEIGQPAVPFLVKELKSIYEDIKLHTAITLLRIGDAAGEEAALPCLVKIIYNRSGDNATKAFVSIRESNSPAVKAVFKDLAENYAGGTGEVCDMARDAIVADESNIPVIIRTMKFCTERIAYMHVDFREPLSALGKKLMKIGKPVIPELTRITRDNKEDENFRIVTLGLLAEMSKKDAIPVIEETVDCQAEKLAIYSVVTLAKFGESVAPAVIKAALTNRNYEVRYYAQQSLIETIGKPAVPALTKQLASVTEKDQKRRL